MNDNVLNVQGLDVFYGSSQALFNLSFEVKRGETLALLGRQVGLAARPLASVVNSGRP